MRLNTLGTDFIAGEIPDQDLKLYSQMFSMNMNMKMNNLNQNEK
jgi:hypothetical protein